MEFQLISLSGVKRPFRATNGSGLVLPFLGRRVGAKMAAIKPEMIADWLRPHEALAALDAVYEKPSISRHLVFERLKSGKIVAVAESSTWKGIQGGDKTGLIAIQRDQWERFIPREEFWKAGELYINLGHYKTSYNTVEVWYHAIKFDPVGVRELVDLAPKPKPSPPPSTEEELPPPAEKGPAVAEEHLRAWYDLYKRVYTGAADTEAMAIKSATGMFPGKSVSRDRIRALRGTQKRGRKPDDAAK